MARQVAGFVQCDRTVRWPVACETCGQSVGRPYWFRREPGIRTRYRCDRCMRVARAQAIIVAALALDARGA